MQIIYKDVKVNYSYYDNNSKTCLVYLHGWGQNIEMMDMLGHPFENEYRVIVLDLPGFGKSDEPAEICICLQDNYGIATQDVCLVRPANGYEHTTEVLVWGNPNDEDYTYKVSINKYMED